MTTQESPILRWIDDRIRRREQLIKEVTQRLSVETFASLSAMQIQKDLNTLNDAISESFALYVARNLLNHHPDDINTALEKMSDHVILALKHRDDRITETTLLIRDKEQRYLASIVYDIRIYLRTT